MMREKRNYSLSGICSVLMCTVHALTQPQLLLSCGHSSPHCCRWWWAWTSTPRGTTACVRSPPCWRWRWCRWSWCNRRRSSGLCCVHRCPKPRQKWSLGPSSPEKRGCREAQGSSLTFVGVSWRGLTTAHFQQLATDVMESDLNSVIIIFNILILFTRPSLIPIMFNVQLQPKLPH